MRLIQQGKFPRLCRGGSRSLTDPGVHRGNSKREPPSARKEISPDGRIRELKPYEVECKYHLVWIPKMSTADGCTRNCDGIWERCLRDWPYRRKAGSRRGI